MLFCSFGENRHRLYTKIPHSKFIPRPMSSLHIISSLGKTTFFTHLDLNTKYTLGSEKCPTIALLHLAISWQFWIVWAKWNYAHTPARTQKQRVCARAHKLCVCVLTPLPGDGETEYKAYMSSPPLSTPTPTQTVCVLCTVCPIFPKSIIFLTWTVWLMA